MNYNDFIDNILNTRGRFNIPKEDYKERHHIIPRCIGGTDEKDNLIDLYAREHFIAHKLLAEESNDERLINALSWFTFKKYNKDSDRLYFNSPEEYEEEKIKVSKLMSDKMKYNNPACREDVKIKLSLNHADIKGKNNPMYGVHRYGDKNPMYGKGDRLKRGKNGRAIKLVCNNITFDCGLDAIDWLESIGEIKSCDANHKKGLRNKLIKSARNNEYFLGYKFKIYEDI